MSAANPTGTGTRRQWVPLLFLLGILTGVGGWLAWVHGSAWSALGHGRAALEDDPAAARGYLDRCLETWPNSGEAHFLAGRAARRCGDLSVAGTHLDAAAIAGWPEGAVEVERALIEVQAGRLSQAEPVLVRHLNDGSPDTPDILPVLVPALMTEFRWVEADVLSAKWVELRPGAAAGWACRGEILERLRRLAEATAALRRAADLAPADRRVRLNLARLLLETRQPAEEAAGHLEWLAGADPGNPAVSVYLAVCREAQGRPDEAARVLDRVIADHPRDVKAYHHRGRLEMNRGRPAEAVGFLRRAAELDPSDPEILYSLFLGLRDAGDPTGAKAAEERWQRCSADLKRVAELGRAVAASPHDPDLRREIGELFLRNGRNPDGIRWLESALRERPDHAPTCLALAAYYDRVGRPDLAARYRSRVTPPGGPAVRQP